MLLIQDGRHADAVTEMEKAVGHLNAAHPEVEAELEEETARIGCKIVAGTVTKAEADHLHSLEARAHGHTEKGGVTATAQSIAAKRENQSSLSGGRNLYCEREASASASGTRQASLSD